MVKLWDEYLKLRPLGTGSYAEVYKVRHREFNYVRALRLLLVHVESKESNVYKQFLRECGVLLKLGNCCHPNIIHLYRPDLSDDGRAFVEMDFVDGIDLRGYIKQCGSHVPAEEIVRMAREIGSALSCCHYDIYKYTYDKAADGLEDDPDDGSKALITPEVEKRLVEKYRIIHNDIHTGNIMRRNDGTYILLDFGLAVDGENDKPGSSRMRQGAIEFKSPERFDLAEPTTQDDIYSFGCVLYAMITGNPPFPIQKTTASGIPESEKTRVYMAHRDTMPEPITRTDIPQWLVDVTMRCLKKSRGERFADGHEMYEEILRHLDDNPKSTADSMSGGTGADTEALERLKAENSRLEELDRTRMDEIRRLNDQLGCVAEELEKAKKDKVNKEKLLGKTRQDLRDEQSKLRKLISDYENKLRRRNHRPSWLLVLPLLILFAGGGAYAAYRYMPSASSDVMVEVDGIPMAVTDYVGILESENNDLKKSNTKLEKDNAKLTEQLGKAGEADNARLAELQAEKENLQRRIKTLEDQLSDSRKSESSLRTTSNRLQNRVKELESSIKSLNNKLADRERQIKNLLDRM